MDKDLPSDSDPSDDDYIPDGQESEKSEVDSDGDPEEPLEAEECTGRKRQAKTKRKPAKKKRKSQPEPPDAAEPQPQEAQLTEEEKKKKADSLWADFMKDTGFRPKAKTEQRPEEPGKPTEKPAERPAAKPAAKVTVTQIFEFAGEEVKVTKEVAADSAEARFSQNPPVEETKRPARKAAGLGGISSVLSQIGKKQKISTLEKTKLDWDLYKKDENLEEEIKSHNKGKDGYLDRQDFLERADHRQFEMEREIRNMTRFNKL